MVINYTAHVSRVDHAACQWNGQAHVLSVMKARVAQRGVMPGSARWLMSHAICHVAASGLLLSGEKKCMWIGSEHTRAGLDTCQLRTPAWALRKVLGPLCGRSGPHTGGPDPILGVRSVHVGVLDQLGGPDCISRGPALSHGGPDSLLTPWSVSLSLATWRPRSRPCGRVRRCCWPRVVARGWCESWSGPTYNSFTTGLKIVAWVLHLHTVVRGTLVSGYRQIPFL
jgi:hypothetical protein